MPLVMLSQFRYLSSQVGVPDDRVLVNSGSDLARVPGYGGGDGGFLLGGGGFSDGDAGGEGGACFVGGLLGFGLFRFQSERSSLLSLPSR